MGGGPSKVGIPSGGVSREQLLKSTQPMRILMDAALQLMLSELAPADLMALGDSGKCAEYAVATGDAFESYFKSLRVVPMMDKRAPRQGIIYFQDLDVLSGKEMTEAQKVEKKQLCATLGFFYTRVFQIYAALALTLFDDANIRPTAVSRQGYDILPYGARAAAAKPGFGMGPGVAVMRGGSDSDSKSSGGAYVLATGANRLSDADKTILGETIFNLFKGYIVEKDTDAKKYRIRYPEGSYARSYIMTLSVPDDSRGRTLGILSLDTIIHNKKVIEAYFEINKTETGGVTNYNVQIIAISLLNTSSGIKELNITKSLHKPLFNNLSFNYTRGTGIQESFITITCGGKPLSKPLALNTTLYRSLMMLYLYQDLIVDKLNNNQPLPSNIYPCRMDVDLSVLNPAAAVAPKPVEDEAARKLREELEKQKKELEELRARRYDGSRYDGSRYDYDDVPKKRPGETDRDYARRLKEYIDQRARGLGWDSQRTVRRDTEDTEDYLDRLKRYIRELPSRRDSRYDYGYGYAAGRLSRKPGESEYEYQKRLREHYREYYKEDRESHLDARIGEVYATLKKGTRPIAHCVARALQLVSFDPSARYGRSYVCNYKFLEPTPTGLPAPGKAISESMGLKSLSTLFAAFSKGQILYQDPGRTEYLNFLRGMSEAFGDDPQRITDSMLPGEGEKSHKPLDRIVNKKDAAGCQRQDVIEVGGKAYANAVAASRILMARQVKHARDVEQIFRELFIINKGVIKIHPQLLALGLPGLDAIATKTRRVLAQYYRECEATYQDAAAAIKGAVIRTKGGAGTD